MNEAIKLAIEKGGYKVDSTGYWLWLGDESAEEKLGKRVHRLLGTDAASIAEIQLDPLFWQALGKALGWSKWTYYEHGAWQTTEDDSIQYQSRTPFVYPTHVHKQVGYVLALNEDKQEQFWVDLIKG